MTKRGNYDPSNVLVLNLRRVHLIAILVYYSHRYDKANIVAPSSKFIG